MKKAGKKAIVVLCLICTFAFTITGCSTIKGTEVVMTVNKQKVTLDFMNFFLRYNQAITETQYGAWFGDDFWSMDLTGSGATYEDTAKDSILQEVVIKILLESHMAEYNVVITDEDKAAIAAAAEQFLVDNDAAVEKKMTATKESISRALELYTIEAKMYEAITADVDTVVSDEEAAQKRISQVLISTAATTDEDGNTVEKTEAELAELKQKAEDILAKTEDGLTLDEAAKAVDESLSATESTYGADSTSVATEIQTAVEGLTDGAYAPVVETASGYYVVQLVANVDREATDANKESIINDRKSEAYTAVVQPWMDEAEVDISTRNLSKVSFKKDSFVIKTAETEDTSTIETESEDASTTETSGETEVPVESQTEDTSAVG